MTNEMEDFGVCEGIDFSRPRERIPTYALGLDDKIQGGVPKGHIVLIGGL